MFANVKTILEKTLNTDKVREVRGDVLWSSI